MPITPTRGSFGTKEAFAEVIIPLANDRPFLRRFDLTGKYRRVDNTVNGAFNAYTYGAQWRPVQELELRGNFTRSLRAPAVTELFTPIAELFTFVPDPCDTRNVTGGTRPEVRSRNCQAFYQQFGLDPNNFTSIAVSATVRGTTGGDPNLLNESADAYTWGFVWEPSFIDRLVIAADYYKIEIDGVIANLNAAAIATGCFDNENFAPGDVTQANQFCQRIIRRPDGQIETITTGFVNGSFLNFTGASGEVRYRIPTNRWGNFDIGASVFYLKRLENSTNGVVTTNTRGEVGSGRYQGQINLSWQQDRLGLFLSQNYESSALFSNTFTVESRDILKVGDYWLTNIGANYRLVDKATLRFAVSNVFDRSPPFPVAGFGIYDQLGRRYTLSANWEF